ncbi:MAG TPA: sulfotransferase [Terriglobales bacterium]|jgi:hypothetical protein
MSESSIAGPCNEISEVARVAKNSSGRMLPSFFIVGPPRTGTTWLHEVLSQRTLLPDPTKETRFFDNHFQRGTAWYRAHFKGAENQRVGEVAPTYFASNEARERIAELVPNARIVCVFRDPVERVFSLYRLKRAYGMIPWSLEEAISRDPELIESGKYATKLKEWWHTFGHESVLPMFYEDLRQNPQYFVNSVADFIGISRFNLTASDFKRIHSSESMTLPKNYYRTRGATLMADWFKARQLDNIVSIVKNSSLIKYFLGGGPAFAKPSPEISAKLYELFRPEVEELENILGRDLSAWKSRPAVLQSAAG